MTIKELQPDSNSGKPRLLTGKQAADYLGIHPKTLWEWVNKGIIAQVKIQGANPKYDVRDLNRLIEQNKKYLTAVGVRKRIVAEIRK